MTTRTAAHVVASYLETLDVYSDLNATFVFGDNLYIGNVLGDSDADEALTIVLYLGEPPITDRQTAAMQLCFKSTSRQTAICLMQRLINELDNSGLNGAGKMKATSSNPILFPATEGGEKIVSMASFTLKHVKI